MAVRESRGEPDQRGLIKGIMGVKISVYSVYTAAQRRRICARPHGEILRGFPSKNPNDGSLDISDTSTYRLNN